MSKRVGRNKPCPCGSGKKYKHCCLNTDQDKWSPAMPGSPRQHELDREAVEHIRSKLPSRWPREEVQNDYGIDLRVEIHENYQVTGLKFEIQSKGHERYRIVYSNQIAQPLKVSTLNYYDNSLLPVLLIVYSAQGKQAHYLWVKPYIKEVLDKEIPDWRQREGDSEITLHVPLMDVFDETVHHDILTHVETVTVKLLRQEEITSFSTSYRRKLSTIQLVTSPRLIRPKITNYLHRPRLTDRLTSGLTDCSVFVHTDAGYGKTWLIHDFITTTSPLFIWYTFNKDVVSAIQFIEELASEVVRQTGDRETKTLTYLLERGRDAKPNEALAILIEEIQTLSFQLLLIIEDVQHISDNNINLMIESLLISRPANLRIILTSRLPLPFGQARLIAQRLLTVIERPEVAFNLNETREYLEKNLELTLSQQQIQYLQERTDGWIAAVALAADAMQETSQNKIDLLFERLTGYSGNIYDFFAEESYLILDTEIQWLLKRLGLIHSLQPGVLDLFTGRADGGQVLRDLAERNTFLVEDDRRDRSYNLHSLFAEFLKVRFQDEEGVEAVKNAHGLLAHYYSEQHEWFAATQHAIEAEEYDLAIQGLEIIAPVGLNSGYSRAVLDMMEQIPEKWLDESASLQEFRGHAASQIGEPVLALKALHKAQELYRTEQDGSALNRLQFLIAEVDLSSDNISAEEFVRVAQRVASNSYKQNEVFFGTQVELRLIEVGKTLTMQYKNLLKELIERCESLLNRIESMGREYALIKARALVALAHLLYQSLTFKFQEEVSKIHIRFETGHPVSEEERISLARIMLEGWQHVWNLYTEAETITKKENEIEWARIRLQRVKDYAHHMGTSVLITGKMGSVQDLSLLEGLKTQTDEIIKGFLPALEECAKIFSKYHMSHDLAVAYCDAADVYDLVGDPKNRDRLAQEAFDLAKEKGLTEIVKRAQKLLTNEFTFTSLREKLNQGLSDKELASLDEEGKARFVGFFLRAYAKDVNVEEMRKAADADINDMVMAAKQRIEWCRHVQIIQDLRHTQSLDTMYRALPKKRIICMELGYKSLHDGYSFDELWPVFKGVYCLGCKSRSLVE